MLGKTYDSQICSIARALEVVGERWTLLIVRDAIFANVRRFGDFQHNLGIATNVLTSRLATLVEAGVMDRGPAAGEYALTDRGRDLAPALVALSDWGDRWASPDEGRPIVYRHTACHGSVASAVVCEHCGSVPADEVAVEPGPGMPREYLANRRPHRGTD